MIRVRNLSKVFRVHQKEPGLAGSIRSVFRRRFTDKHALKGVSLDIAAGEIVGLVGANGAGKTTLVKSLAGIIHPSGGEAEVLGYVPWERRNAFRRQIALIMGQKAQLWWDLPAADGFLLLKEIYQISERDFRERLDFLTATLDVKDQLIVQVRRLSLGERMKMELIAALLHQPRVVFLDEPTIGLDLTAQRSIREFILKYRREHSPAMLLTSHYMEDIERLCERIVIIRQGEFVFDGSLSQIARRFATHKVLSVQVEKRNGFEMPPGLGEILPGSEGQLRVRVAREKVAEAATVMLKGLQVKDLSIEEEEIGTLIEQIMRKGRG